MVAFCGGDSEEEGGDSDGDFVSGFESDSVEDFDAVDEGAVVGFEISDVPDWSVGGEFGVSAGDGVVGDGECFGGASDELGFSEGELVFFALVWAFDDGEFGHLWRIVWFWVAYNGGVAKAGTKKAGGTNTPSAEHRVVVLTGKELFLRSQYTAMLKERLEKEHGEIEVFKFEGESVDPAEVLDECRSFGLMSGHKLVVVDGADSFVNAGTRAMIERYVEAPSEGATLVLRAGKWNKGKLDVAIGKVGIMIKCDAVDEGTACRWVMARAQKQYESSIDQRTAAGLVERLGADLGRIDTELSKLATAAGKGNPITGAMVTELVGLTREEEVWAIQSYLLCGNPERALSELRVILGNSKNDNAVPVLFACSDLARKVMGASEGMASGMNPGMISKELKLWGASKDAILRTAKRLGPAGSRRLFESCIAADVASKSSGIDTRIMLERLVLSFVAASR